MCLDHGFVGSMNDLNMAFIPPEDLAFMDGENSDREDAASAAECEDGFTDADYWFGGKYFRCVLALDIFRRVTPGCSVVTIDVRREITSPGPLRPY